MKKSILLLFVLFATHSFSQCFDIVFDDAMKDYKAGQYLKALEKLDKSAKCEVYKKDKLLLWRDSCRIKIENQLTNSIELIKGLVPDSVKVFYAYFYTLAKNELLICNFSAAARYMRFARLSPDLPSGMLAKLSKEVADCDFMNQTNQKAIAHYRKMEYTKAEEQYNLILKLLPRDSIVLRRIEYCKNPVFKKENLVLIKGGTYTMGSDASYAGTDETPHQVTLTDFYLGKYEVTNEEFAEFLNIYGSEKILDGEYAGEFMIDYGWNGIEKKGRIWRPAVDNSGKYDDYPVMRVSWFGANEFCKFWNGTLPSEAQWEFAARSGGKDFKYSWGNDEPNDDNPKKFGNIGDKSAKRAYPSWTTENFDDGYAQTAPAGKYDANKLGIYDMSGNVWEWCNDWYDSKFYGNSENANNPVCKKKGFSRVLRGGSWDLAASNCRTADRNSTPPGNRNSSLGFRFSVLP